jgi:antitoxin HigA-1
MIRSKKLPPIHPGEILKEEIMAPRKISQIKLAQGINVSPKLISEICQKKRNIDGEMALRLAVYFGISAQFWMNLQQHYDLEVSKDLFEKQIKREIKPLICPKENVSRLRKLA